MRFSTALSTLVLLVPLLTGEALGARAGRGGKGGKGGTGTSSSSAAASSSTAVVNNSTGLANPGTNNNTGDPQTSLTLDPNVIATGFEQDGQQTPTAGQVASLTSSNNFINFCLTVPNLPITNGKQIKTGSCNPAPLGIIAATTNMPSSKFVQPVNGQDFPANTAFDIKMAINNLETGNFVNAQANYYAAPQQVNGQGDIIGHTHFTVQDVGSVTSTTPLDPSIFAFFKGVNGAAVNGVLTESVSAGLPAGTYRVCSMNTDANHTPCLVAVAQHGFLDDCVYFTVGGAGNNNPFAGSGAGNSTANAPPAASSAAAASSAPPVASSAAAASSAPPAASSVAAASSAAPPAASSAAAGGGGKKKGGRKGGRGRQSARFARE